MGTNPPQAKELLYDETVCPSEMRNFIWGYLRGSMRSSRKDSCTVTANTFGQLIYSHDGRLLATGGGGVDGTVKIWDANTGELKTSYWADAGGVWDVQFAPDDRVSPRQLWLREAYSVDP